MNLELNHGVAMSEKCNTCEKFRYAALKDLIGRVQGGVLITGREYYFNSDKELLNCLGLPEDQTTILECHHEFTDSELLAFNFKKHSGAINKKELDTLPTWLPKMAVSYSVTIKICKCIFSIDYAL